MVKTKLAQGKKKKKAIVVVKDHGSKWKSKVSNKQGRDQEGKGLAFVLVQRE